MLSLGQRSVALFDLSFWDRKLGATTFSMCNMPNRDGWAVRCRRRRDGPQDLMFVAGSGRAALHHALEVER